VADETEKIVYDISITGDGKIIGVTKKIADSFENISDSSKKATSSTGNYSDALNKLAPGLESTVKGAGGVLNSFKALIASPIGLTLAAVAGAFTVIKAAIEKSEPALDFIEDIMTKISTVANTLLNNLSTVGKFFGNLLVGDLNAAGDAFNKLTDEISKNNAEAQRFLDLSRELEDAQAAFTIANADAEDQIKALIVASKNRNLTFDESQAKIKQALDLEKQVTDQRVKLAQQEAEIAVGKIALDKGLRQQQNESFEEFVKRITRSGELSGEAAQKVADFYAKTKQAASENLAFQEKAQNRLDEIAIKRQADYERELENKRKADEQYWKDLTEGEKNAQAREAEIAKQKKEADETALKEGQEVSDLFVAIEEQKIDREVENFLKSSELRKKETEDKKKQIQIDFLLNQQKLSNLSTALNQAAGLLDKNSTAYKTLAISQAFIDTYRAATAALAPPPIGAGPLFGPILAATTIGLGLANVAKIAGFAEGGLSGTKIMAGMGKSIYRSNGDNMLATVKTGEVILNEDQQAALGGSRTFAAIGVPGFATGGITDTQLTNSINNNAIASQISSDRNIGNLITAIQSSSQKVLVIEDVENLINQRISIRETANL